MWWDYVLQGAQSIIDGGEECAPVAHFHTNDASGDEMKVVPLFMYDKEKWRGMIHAAVKNFHATGVALVVTGWQVKMPADTTMEQAGEIVPSKHPSRETVVLIEVANVEGDHHFYRANLEVVEEDGAKTRVVHAGRFKKVEEGRVESRFLAGLFT